MSAKNNLSFAGSGPIYSNIKIWWLEAVFTVQSLLWRF